MGVRLRIVGSDDWLQLMGLVDTGADVSVIPSEIADARLPVAGTVAIRGITGDTQDVVLYRAELRVGEQRYVTVFPALGTELILGRDVINRLVLSLDGPAGELEVVHGQVSR
ncbi:MAG: hypothetical protein WD826_12195 [Actinomycetota bacterium]